MCCSAISPFPPAAAYELPYLPPFGDHGKTLTARLLVKMLQAVRRA